MLHAARELTLSRTDTSPLLLSQGEQMLFWVQKGSRSGRTQLGQGTFICCPEARSHTAKGDKYMEHPESRVVQLDLGKNLGFLSLLFV